MRFLIGLLAPLFFGLLFSNINTEAQAETQILRRGGAGDPESLDPHRFINAFEGTILTDLFMGLVASSSEDKSIPGAASSWIVSDDGMAITFQMRDGITWSDGKPVTAEDFVYSFRRIMDPATASTAGSLLRPIVNAERVSQGELPPEALGIEAPSPDTFIIHLQHPAPYLIEVLSFIGLPVPQHTIEEYGSSWIRPENMVVNGPYQQEEWITSSHVKLTKNPRFYDTANVFFDEVFHIPVEDTRAALTRFRAGDLDSLVTFPPDQMSLIEREMPGALRISPSLSVESYYFNTTAPPFDDVRVRRALSMAIDRETLTERVLRTGEQPAYGYVSPATLNYPKRAEVDFKTITYLERLVQARSLLAEAGFGSSIPLHVPLRYNTQDVQLRVASAVAAMWKRIGVETELINTERRVLAADRFQGNFKVARALRVSATYDPSYALLNIHSRLSDMNLTRYDSEVYNRLFERAWYSPNLNERASLLYEAEMQALADHPIIPLYFQLSRNLVQSSIDGWVDNARGIHPSRWLSRH